MTNIFAFFSIISRSSSFAIPFDKLLDGHDGEIFNIGADKYFTINEAAETVKRVGKKYGYDATIEHAEARHEAKHAYCNHNKAKTLLNFSDQTELESSPPTQRTLLFSLLTTEEEERGRAARQSTRYPTRCTWRRSR